MRIPGGNGAKQVGRAGGNGRARAASGSFTVPQESQSATQPQSSVQNSAVQDVSSLLALQAVEDSLQGRSKKAVRRGNKILDLLEDVRMGLLSGSLPLALLHQLDRLIVDQEKVGDERIDGLLAEIGLRAQVEIAKLEVQGARKARI